MLSCRTSADEREAVFVLAQLVGVERRATAELAMCGLNQIDISSVELRGPSNTVVRDEAMVAIACTNTGMCHSYNLCIYHLISKTRIYSAVRKLVLGWTGCDFGYIPIPE